MKESAFAFTIEGMGRIFAKLKAAEAMEKALRIALTDCKFGATETEILKALQAWEEAS